MSHWYGAGKYGDIALRTLYNENLYEDIKCFAVTNISEERVMASKPICTIEEAYKRYPGRVVLIAVAPGSENYKSIQSSLAQIGINNILNIEDILDNYYIL